MTKTRIDELEAALREVDELRHKAKEGEDIIDRLKKPCMVLYNKRTNEKIAADKNN